MVPSFGKSLLHLERLGYFFRCKVVAGFCHALRGFQRLTKQSRGVSHFLSIVGDLLLSLQIRRRGAYGRVFKGTYPTFAASPLMILRNKYGNRILCIVLQLIP